MKFNIWYKSLRDSKSKKFLGKMLTTFLFEKKKPLRFKFPSGILYLKKHKNLKWLPYFQIKYDAKLAHLHW